LALDEIVCCDPMGGNKYSVTFRLAGPSSGQTTTGTFTRVEVRVTTDGVVAEKEISWTSR